MSKDKQLFQSALDVIIDGVAVSSVGGGRTAESYSQGVIAD